MSLSQDNKETLDLTVLCEVSKAINNNLEISSMIQSIYHIMETFLGVDDISLWLWNDNTNLFRLEYNAQKQIKEHIINDLELKFSQNGGHTNDYLVFVYSDKKFITVDKDHNADFKIISQDTVICLPLYDKETLIGVIAFNYPKTIGEKLSLNDIMLFRIVATQIATAVLNYKFREQIQTNAFISTATRDIAKIIESQYELEYVIPIMGEIMDKHISNALIYIFLRDNENGFKLSWPASYSKDRIDPLLDKMGKALKPVILDTKTATAIPIIHKEDLVGAIVADGKTEELSYMEIEFLKELAKQCSITISRANAYAETVKHATIDALTSLDNRRQIDKRLLQEASVVIRTKRHLSVLMIDVDHFKKINDTHGHSVGDYVLKEIAKVIRSTIREYDIAGRYGGEEFVVLLPDTNMIGAKRIAERLRVAVENRMINIGKFASSKADVISVTISIGISEFDSNYKNPADIYEEADIALYRAKQEGRNRVILFNE